MPPFELTLEYRKTPEYAAARQEVLQASPGLNDFMVDIAILMAKRYPDLPKRYRNAEKVEPTVLPSTIEGSVLIE